MRMTLLPQAGIRPEFSKPAESLDEEVSTR